MRKNVLGPRRFRNQFLVRAAQCSLGHGAIIQELSALQTLLGMAEPIYCPINESDYIQTDKPEQFFSRRLRICPTCSRRQYHSNLFQINGLARCPVHQVALTTSCPICDKPLSACTLTGATLRAHWGCERCGWPHHARHENIFISTEEVDHLRLCFEPTASLVRRIGEVANNAPWLRDLQYGGHHISRACAYRIAACWLGAPSLVTEAVGPDEDFPMHIALPPNEVVVDSSAEPSQVKRSAYFNTHCLIVRQLTPIFERIDNDALFDKVEWRIGEPTFRRCLANRVDIPKQVLAYRWWRTAFEVNRGNRSFDILNINEGAFDLRKFDSKVEEALQGAQDLWEQYFLMTYKVFEILASRWQLETNSLLTENRWSEATVRSYYRNAWEEQVAGICTSSHSAFPLQVVKITEGEPTQLPPGSVLFFSTIPNNYLQLMP
ncbi:hypothetical protein LMG6000_00418 [Achromobacter insolitus]|uniref:TniQ protein n=2 Tax=Achromobacter insolitus TaxID=217204 RepID=A0A6S7F0Y4_9BURK|nr:hypothetical protein LMG6000_00418 [Achromobacter insolitus]CAB3944831.1 hypothetical protein LMG5997_05469 [Achromobacter insolitus]